MGFAKSIIIGHLCLFYRDIFSALGLMRLHKTLEHWLVNKRGT